MKKRLNVLKDRHRLAVGISCFSVVLLTNELSKFMAGVAPRKRQMLLVAVSVVG